MARVASNFWGIVLILNYQETQEVCSVAANVATVMDKIAGALDNADLEEIGFILEALALYISVHVLIIEACDKGNGVYLTTPRAALGLTIPTTRAANIGLSDDWATIPSGMFQTEDSADRLEYQIQQNAVSADIVEFSLQSSVRGMWRKVLVLRDGLGSQWDIAIDPSQGTSSASNSLWAAQVRNNQALSLWKAKTFGIMTWVLDIQNLSPIAPGSRVTFTWLKD